MSERQCVSIQRVNFEQARRRKTNLRGAGIGVDWEGTAVRADKMRQAFTNAAARARFTYLTKRIRRERNDQFALSFDAGKISAWRPGRLAA